MTSHNLGKLHRHQLAAVGDLKTALRRSHTAIHHGHVRDDPPTVARPTDGEGLSESVPWRRAAASED
jgi:hypothetical protein